MQHNIYDLNENRLEHKPDGALQISAGMNCISPSNIMSTESVNSMMTNNQGLLHWTAHQFRSLPSTIKAAPERMDMVCREETLLKLKRRVIRCTSP